MYAYDLRTSAVMLNDDECTIPVLVREWTLELGFESLGEFLGARIIKLHNSVKRTRSLCGGCNDSNNNNNIHFPAFQIYKFEYSSKYVCPIPFLLKPVAFI